MTSPAIHLVKVPLRADKLAGIAKHRGLRLRDLDEGYLVHCLLAEVWQDSAPSPFVVRGSGRTIDVWGYSSSDASMLIEHARSFGDPELLESMGGGGTIASRPMPVFATGRTVGFLTRVCPVVRLAKSRNGHRAGAELDAFLSACFATDAETSVSREDTYREWFVKRFGDSSAAGATVARVAVAAMMRSRVVRRTQGAERQARVLERPDVRLEGELVIEDGAAFLRLLARGVGRHRAFGFGALMVVAPGTTHEPS